MARAIPLPFFSSLTGQQERGHNMLKSMIFVFVFLFAWIMLQAFIFPKLGVSG